MIEVHQHSAASCPYCKAAFRPFEPAVRCDQCGTQHHSICWLQNDNHCSIFRCAGSADFPVRIMERGLSVHAQARKPAARNAGWKACAPPPLRSILTLHCLCNVAIHFFIHPVGRLLESIHPADALALLVMECGIAAGGLALLAKLLYDERYSENTGSLSMMGSVLVATNIVFVSFLLYILISEGIHSLYALISF